MHHPFQKWLTKKAHSWARSHVFGSEYLSIYLKSVHFCKVPEVINLDSEVGILPVLKNGETVFGCVHCCLLSMKQNTWALVSHELSEDRSCWQPQVVYITHLPRRSRANSSKARRRTRLIPQGDQKVFPEVCDVHSERVMRLRGRKTRERVFTSKMIFFPLLFREHEERRKRKRERGWFERDTLFGSFLHVSIWGGEGTRNANMVPLTGNGTLWFGDGQSNHWATMARAPMEFF